MAIQHSEPNSRQIVRVIVDYGERWSGVPRALESTPGVRVGFDRLSLGDYLINDRVVIERKTIVDFAQSIQDGRLFRQCAQLAGLVSRKPCLLLEGTMADFASVRLRLRALQGAMVTVAVRIGLPVLRSRNVKETANLIIMAGRQLSRTPSYVPVHRGSKIGSRKRTQLVMLQSIPEIGPRRALALLKLFGSVEAIVCASIESLAAVPGIGMPTARRIKWTLGAESQSTKGNFK